MVKKIVVFSRQTFPVPIFILSISMFLSCKPDGVDDPDATNGIIPLKLGNSWTYLDSLYYLGQFSSSLEFTTELQRKETHNAKIFYVGFERLRNVDESTVEVHRSSGVDEIYLKRVNNITVVYSDTLSHFDTTVHQLVAYPSLYAVMGYDCLKNEELFLTSGNIIERRIYYFKPNVGLIRMESYQGNVLLDTRSLVRYSLN